MELLIQQFKAALAKDPAKAIGILRAIISGLRLVPSAVSLLPLPAQLKVLAAADPDDFLDWLDLNVAFAETHPKFVTNLVAIFGGKALAATSTILALRQPSHGHVLKFVGSKTLRATLRKHYTRPRRSVKRAR